MSANAISHRIHWFEIPVTDLTRAMTFFSTVLETDFHVSKMDDGDMAIFDSSQEAVSGCLTQSAHMQPSATGTVVYFNAGEDLARPLGRVEAAGGKVIVPKTLITPEIGYFAIFADTEGNTVGLHSPH